MSTLKKVALLAVALLALGACLPAAPVEVPPAKPTPVEVPPVEPTPVASVNLAGTSWVLSSVHGELPLPGTTVTLQFGTDGTVSGSDGCNRFSTTFTQDGANLTIHQPAASTMMACAESVMNQAAAYMAALAGTTNFIATERQLILRAGDQILATFVTSSQSLADTAWEVTAYNNGRMAVVGLILGTEISANFSADGTVAGNAGCNQYFTSYSTKNNTIEIGPAGATRRFCAEPPGVMEQESEYLAALESAATYSIQGNMLEMRTAADQIAVVMIRKIVVDLPAPAPTPATPTGRVTGTQGLNIRSGPGVNFPVIGLAREGDEGEIVGRSADGRWWAVLVPSAPGGIGWVSADFVIARNVENVPVIAAPPPPVVIVPTAAPPPATPTPPPPPAATPSPTISFWADRTSINQGECATLHWSVENVQAVWVYPRGEPFDRYPRVGQGSEQVCPRTTTTYEMRVLLRDGSTLFREITINVAAPTAPPPTATSAPPPPTATTAPAPNPLPGTRWEVANYNDGRGALVTLIIGTRISMDFGADGQVTGSSGCNQYFASYQVVGNGITIGQPGSTSMLCAEPEGVMEQEAEFLGALQTAATFRIDGNMLEMRTAGDQIAIIASRVP